MCTVSPARKRARSKIVCATARRVPALRRQLEAPRLDAVAARTSGRSSCRRSVCGDDEQAAVEIGRAPWRRSSRDSRDRRSPRTGRRRSQRGACSASGRPVKRARPCASVTPVPSTVPWQSCTATCAPATGLASSSVVTQTSAFSRAHLKCTERLVTSAPAGRTSARRSPSSAAPRRGLASSTR